jgi:hypothetical protein
VFAGVSAVAPDELSMMAAFLSSPEGDPVVGVFAVYRGSEDESRRVLAPLREFGSPLLDDIGPKPYTVIQQAFDAGFPTGSRNYWKSSFLEAVGDDCIDTLVEHADRAPSPMCVVALEHMIGGAVARIGADETAFGGRDAEYNLLVLGMGDDPSIDDALKAWARSTREAVQPFATGGVYVNYMDRDESERVESAYGSERFARLAELKRRYDPDNLFRLNQNIAPSGKR